jgi:stage V sporulation protein D (sporulation-specific penicillin-binding protein)
LALPTRESKFRIMIFSILLFLAMGGMLARIGYLQIVRGEELGKEALNQWSRGIPITPVRGTIYDSNGTKLALSLNRDTVWARPEAVKESGMDKTIETLSTVLEMDKESLKKTIEEGGQIVKVKQWIEKDQSEKLKKANLNGIDIVEDSKRYYPKGEFASYILGHTNVDQVGQYGIESVFNKELTGTEGKLIKIADGKGEQLPYGEERIYEPKDGYDIKLTIDSKIQEIAELAVKRGMEEHAPKNAAAIVMNPNTGDILAMASGPGYDLNSPKDIKDESIKETWDDISAEEKQNAWFDMWRNYNINDAYEPGSTFKTLVVAAALEENLINMNSTFYCDGYATGIESSTPIRCWRYYNPHGHQTLSEGLQNSCNDMMVDIALLLGREKLYEYTKSFGFGSKTGIDLTGESTGIIPPSAEGIKDATLANISFGQGVAVTPIQLITAISSIANGGDLMKPNIVAEITDQEGNVISKSEPEVVKKVISEETAKEVLSMMGDTARDSYVGKLDVPGYNIGAKTGTAQKIVDGAYSNEKHIGSFVGVAPLESPEIIVLTIMDESTSGSYFGIDTAAPIGEEIMINTLKYLEIERSDMGDGAGAVVEVPDVKDKPLREAVDILKEAGLDYTTDSYYMNMDDPVLDQYPDPMTTVKYGSFVKLYLEGKRTENIVVPNLLGKSKAEAETELDSLGLKYGFSGEGSVVKQEPQAETIIDGETIVTLELE